MIAWMHCILHIAGRTRARASLQAGSHMSGFSSCRRRKARSGAASAGQVPWAAASSKVYTSPRSCLPQCMA